MKNGPQIPPAVAIIVIVLVVAVVGVFLYRGTGAKKGSMSADQQAKMREYTSKMGMDPRTSTSGPVSTGGAAGGRVLGGPPPNAPK